MVNDILKVLDNFVRCILESNTRVNIDEIIKVCKDRSLKELVNYNFKTSMNYVNNHLDLVVEGLRSIGYTVLDVLVKSKTSLLVGVSEGFLKEVFEIGLIWDTILGLPYIPGSSIKGALRSTAVKSCLERTNNQNDRLECILSALRITGLSESPFISDELDYIKLYIDCKILEQRIRNELKNLQSTGTIGLIFIADSYPVGTSDNSGKIINPDIIAPHYDENVIDEYSVSPRPLPHVSIKPGTLFRIIIGVKPQAERYARKLARIIFGRELSLNATILSLLALTLQLGIGARTTKGYGYFDLVSFNIVR